MRGNFFLSLIVFQGGWGVEERKNSPKVFFFIIRNIFKKKKFTVLLSAPGLRFSASLNWHRGQFNEN